MASLEHILIKPFNQLKEIAQVGNELNTYKPAYDYGTKKDLDRFLLIKGREEVKHYPLVWCLTPIKPEGKRPSAKVTIFLAMLNENHNMSNRERTEAVITPYLEPLKEDVFLRLDLCKSVKRVKKDQQTEEYHYNIGVQDGGGSEKEENKALTHVLWDAIKIELTLELTGCECN